MKFEDALRELRNGKKIRRESWKIHGIMHPLLPNTKLCVDYECFHAEDWEIIEEPGKTFPEVFEAFKEGKLIKRKSWPSEYFCCSEMNSNHLSHIDLIATDWMICDD